MSMKSRAGHRLIALAVSTTAVFAVSAHLANADTFVGTIANTDGTPGAVFQNEIETSGPYGGTNRLSIEGYTVGGDSFAAFATLDLNAASISTDGGATHGLPSLTQVTGINQLALNLTDYDEYFSAAGKIDIYISNNNGPVSGLTYLTDAASQPQGIGHQLDTLFSVGQINYTPANSTTSGAPGPSAGTNYLTNLTLSSAAQSYVINQLNTGGNVRLVLAADSPTVSGDFYSTTSGATAPYLTANLTTATFTPANSTLTINGGKTVNLTFPRIVTGYNANQSLTLLNSGTEAGTYTATGVARDTSNPQSATGFANITASTNPLAAGANTTILAGMNANIASAGFGPVTATTIIHDASNPTGDSDITINSTATQVVANRFVNSQGNTAGINFAPGQKGILGGTSATQNVTFVTTNTGVPDFSYNSLTELELLGSASTPLSALNAAGTGVTDQGAIAADTDINHNITFGSPVAGDDGSQTAVRSVTFQAGTGTGGLYATNHFYDGYSNLSFTQLDTAAGANGTPLGRMYFSTDVYQPANVTSNATGTTITLTNLKHTTNNAKISGVTTDIGARAAAQVTSVSMTAQGGWSVDPGLVPSLTIADGQTVAAANFDATGKLNGNYSGNLTLGLQNEQDLLGATPNDIGPKSYTLAATVSTNSGNGTANILPGGSLAGYYINRGSGKNTTASFLAGTSTSGGNISVSWSDGTNTTLSDRAAISTTAPSDLYVLQMSYDNTAITNGTTSPTLAALLGGKFVGATGGDTGATPVEINGAYDNNLVLGHYGIDTTNHTVWAVLNYAGDFEVTQRLLGDANGDGKIDLSDLSTVLNNFGTPTALWSHGNFDGAATINLTDLSDVLNNFGTSVPNASLAPAIVATGTGQQAVPEPASLALLALGALPLLKRRRR
ncbi:MAG: beta strand repeat-containing protein [Phycisphaerae bacterium]